LLFVIFKYFFFFHEKKVLSVTQVTEPLPVPA